MQVSHWAVKFVNNQLDLSVLALKGNDILLLFAILFLWLNLENHLHSQNALIVSEYKIIVI